MIRLYISGNAQNALWRLERLPARWRCHATRPHTLSARRVRYCLRCIGFRSRFFGGRCHSSTINLWRWSLMASIKWLVMAFVLKQLQWHLLRYCRLKKISHLQLENSLSKKSKHVLNLFRSGLGFMWEPSVIDFKPASIRTWLAASPSPRLASMASRPCGGSEIDP